MKKPKVYKNISNIQKLSAVIVITAVAIIGIHYLITSFAASSFVTVNADSGTVADGAQKASCTGSTDGNCVEFGSASVTGEVLVTETSATLGNYFATPSDQALYTSTADSSGVSNCTGTCLSVWPAYQDTGSTTGLPSGVGTIKRTDNGEIQYTYNGLPLYTFASDSPGQVTGNGVSTFVVAKPASTTGTATALNIMPLGDSITDGYVVPGGYRTALWQDLTQTNKDDINFVGSVGQSYDNSIGAQLGVGNVPTSLGDLNVNGQTGYNHEGNSGWCTDDTAGCAYGQNIEDSVAGWLTTYKPELILLHTGTNDIDSNNQDAAQVEASLTTLLGTIYSTLPKVHVIVAQIIGISDYSPFDQYSAEEATVTAYDADIPSIASSFSAKGDSIQVVNMNILNPDTDYWIGNDGSPEDQDYHPNQAGYNLMAATWEPLVQAQYTEYEANPW